MTLPGGSIGVSDEGKSVRIVYENEEQQVQINGLLSDQSIVRLVEPLAGCDFLILGERIAGRSAFEFLPLIRAIAPSLHICLLLSPPVSDYTYLRLLYQAPGNSRDLPLLSRSMAGMARTG